MNNRRIPIPKIPGAAQSVIRPSFYPVTGSENVTFSFSSLERTEYFNLDATCQNWSSEMLDMMKVVSSTTKREVIQGKLGTLRVHTHEGANPPNTLPAGVALKDCYQLRISKSKGGIHGVFYESIFFVIWLDPLHNLYPDKHHGGLRIIKPPSTCCMDRDSEIEKLQNEIKKLKEDLEYLENEIGNK